MNTQVQTVPGAGITGVGAAAALAVMARVLLDGWQDTPRTAERSALAVAVLGGVTDPDTLIGACRDDVTTQFGVEPTQFGLLAYTPRLVVMGFHARTVAGGQAMTPLMRERVRDARAAAQRSAAAGAGRDLDPVWGVFPWGLRPSDDNATRENWALGVAEMLNERWDNAIYLLQYAAGQCANLHPREQFWVRRSLAANIRLAVKYSHGEAV
jgi:hypothetical protein